MSDYLERIRMAQVMAREQAVINGIRDPAAIHMAGVDAAEQLVIAELRQKESTGAAKNNVVPFPSNRQKP